MLRTTRLLAKHYKLKVVVGRIRVIKCRKASVFQTAVGKNEVKVAPNGTELLIFIPSADVFGAQSTFTSAYAQSSAFLVHFRPQRRLD